MFIRANFAVICLVWLSAMPCSLAARQRHLAPLDVRQQEDPPFSFSTSWQVLGPFQIGTREATWGADPLEYIGGFSSLNYDPKAEFRSSLPTNGIAKWNLTDAMRTSISSTSANATLSVAYSNVDWGFLKVVYGWAAVQYQAWARGELTVHSDSPQHIILYTDAILEYWIDGVHYFGGDFFTFRKAPAVLHLSPGNHQIDLRLVRDVRAFGGILAPTIDVVVHAETAAGTLELAKPDMIISDVVDGKLASPFSSVFLRNSGEGDIEIVSIDSSDVGCPVSLQNSGPQEVLSQDSRVLTAVQTNSSIPSDINGIVLVSGQTRPVTMNVSLPARSVSSLKFTITYRVVGTDSNLTLAFSQKIKHKTLHESHKTTFLHPGGIVSYAMLRPPAKNVTCRYREGRGVPVLLALHGAGLEADNDMVAHALDPVPDLCAFVLYPTGVTPWSGDDWHNWGFADVEAAVNSIPNWIDSVEWKGPDIDVDRWIVMGHSNGGQGTWYGLTHRPDKILAAAPLSAYTSIQKYVPYELWQPADPRRTAVLSASINSYRHEMLMPNAQGIPIQQQHGEIDDNVPAYNSRLLSQQLFLSGTNSSYNEVAGQNHWWNTVMTTPELVQFYRKQTQSNDSIPRKLTDFEIVVGDPGDMGSKGGIKVLLLDDPGQYGRVTVEGHSITTSNILSLEFKAAVWETKALTIDGSEVTLSQGIDAIMVSKDGEDWTIVASNKSTTGRRGRQLGSMTAILRTQGPFIIRHDGSAVTAHLALQVSRNLHQYFQADANIITSNSPGSAINSTGNVITFAVGDDIPQSGQQDFPILPSASGVSVRDSKGKQHTYGKHEQPVGAIFLRPLEGERLELVVWGSDQGALALAARLVPMVTGVGQPDFVVLGAKARWKGVDGALAMGFFDSKWRVTASSVVS